MKACYDKDGNYITNEQSWVGEPKWPEGSTVLEAGATPWDMTLVAGKLVVNQAKIDARDTLEAEKAAEAEREAKIQVEMQRIAYEAAEQSLIDKGEIAPKDGSTEK